MRSRGWGEEGGSGRCYGKDPLTMGRCRRCCPTWYTNNNPCGPAVSFSCRGTSWHGPRHQMRNYLPRNTSRYCTIPIAWAYVSSA